MRNPRNEPLADQDIAEALGSDDGPERRCVLSGRTAARRVRAPTVTSLATSASCRSDSSMSSASSGSRAASSSVLPSSVPVAPMSPPKDGLEATISPAVKSATPSAIPSRMVR